MRGLTYGELYRLFARRGVGSSIAATASVLPTTPIQGEKGPFRHPAAAEAVLIEGLPIANLSSNLVFQENDLTGSTTFAAQQTTWHRGIIAPEMRSVLLSPQQVPHLFPPFDHLHTSTSQGDTMYRSYSMAATALTILCVAIMLRIWKSSKGSVRCRLISPEKGKSRRSGMS